MMEMKEEQTKMKANPPGTSKILARARKKAMEEQEKKVKIGKTRKYVSKMILSKFDIFKKMPFFVAWISS